jgi:ribosomal protein S18 acetylase RimI-like enzyme
MKKSRKEFVNTRWTIRRDFPNIVEINNQNLPEITQQYLIELHRNTQKPVSLVAEIKEVVVGFVIYFVRSNRYEISHLAVDESYKRMGVATVLITTSNSKLHRMKTLDQRYL